VGAGGGGETGVAVIMTVELAPRATVLVVEDQNLLRESTARLLESLGYRVLVAADGPGALGLLDEGAKVDLLLSDVVLPGGMTGDGLATEVQRRDPGIRILLTSAYQREVLVAQGRLASQRPLLKKPFRRRELEKFVQEVLTGEVTGGLEPDR
jgi:CheY-like chemotaxis protein